MPWSQCSLCSAFEYCFECPEYEQHSCKKYEESAKKCADYNVDLRANFERIKAGEIEAWLEECEEKFRCPECEEPLPALGWNKKKCYHCDADLK